ncbi:MAG: hypothetical protein RBT11_00645 [Desulfobacterales bacterium]|nr:hypothetical protein [Desulfobacterales bacterium]
MAVGEFFPDISLSPLFEENDRAYLGIAKGQYFTVNDIQADLVLVEIMNVHCASCKKQAPVLNELFALIDADQQVRSKIRILAVAVGNTDKEIAVFKKRFKVPFPLVGDPNYMVWDATGRSGTPLSIYVRRNRDAKTAVVVGSHLGFQAQAKLLFDEVLPLLKTEPSAFIKSTGIDSIAKTEPTPLFSEQKMMELMVMAIFKTGVAFDEIKSVALEDGGAIYISNGKKDGKPVRLFIKPVYRFLPCDACHDAQFFYIFQSDGKIVDFVPIQLTKYGNQPFTEKDTNKLRGRFVGKNISDLFVFDPAVDAVSAATITSSVVYKAFSEGKALYEELKKQGQY